MEDETIVADNTELETATLTDTDTTGESTATEVQGDEVADTTNNATQINETKAYSERLNAHAQKKVDEEYSRMFGEEYGIHSKSEYDRRIAENKQAEQDARFEEHGIDPNEVKGLFEQYKQTDPDFQELNAWRAEKNINSALADLNNELKDAGVDLNLKDLSESEVSKLPNIDKVIANVEKGHSFADAFFLANKKDIIGKQTAKIQQDTIAKISANGASSPGSLISSTTTESFFTKEQVQKMSTEDVRKNYDTIMKSTKKW